MSIFAKSLFVPSTIALSLLAVIGTAQAQQDPSAIGSATRKIEVITGKQVALAAQPDADVNAETDTRPTNAVAGANQADVEPVDANAQSDTPQSITGPAPQRTETKVIISEETKRLNRQRYIERYEASQYEEPRYTQQYAEPRYEERYVHAQPRYEERYVKPRYVEPRYVAPRHYAPREVYVQRYHAAPSYGHVRRTAEHRSHRGYGY